MLAQKIERKYAEVEARSEAKGKAESIVRVLSARFGPVDPSLEASIRAISDPVRLDDLVVRAATVVSLDEFAVGE